MGEEELGVNGKAKMQISLGYCHLSPSVLALKPLREAFFASILFSGILDSWGTGDVNKKGVVSCPHWRSRSRARKDNRVHLYGNGHVREGS